MTGDLAGQVARLFYDGQQSKVEIAARLGISRFRVARLLDQARANGLVRIVYRDLGQHDLDLAHEIESRWSLDMCLVTARDAPASVAADQVAASAGSLIDELVIPGDVVGIAWGSTLARVAAAVPVRHDPSLTVVPLAGGSSRLPAGRDPGDVARALADRLGAAHHRLFAPAFLKSRKLRDALAREPEVAATLACYRELRVAIVGIGAIGRGAPVGATSSLVASGALSSAAIRRLVARGAIGDLVVHPFDARGRFVSPDLETRAVAIDTAGLRRVPKVVAVASGTAKAAAIRGALATGLVRILVTDAATARLVLDADATDGSR